MPPSVLVLTDLEYRVDTTADGPNALEFSRAEVDKVSTVDVGEEGNRTLELVEYHLRKQQIGVVPEFASAVSINSADQ